MRYRLIPRGCDLRDEWDFRQEHWKMDSLCFGKICLAGRIGVIERGSTMIKVTVKRTEFSVAYIDSVTGSDRGRVMTVDLVQSWQ